VTFSIWTRQYSDTNIARCESCQASSTNSPECAAATAAAKAFSRWLKRAVNVDEIKLKQIIRQDIHSRGLFEAKLKKGAAS
jgi:predicted hydrocarbon binding protein